MPDKKVSLGQLFLPSIRCEMGNWIYYSTSMRLGDVVDYIQLADEIANPERLDAWIQRKIEPVRTTAIAAYLQDQPEHFFNSLVVTVYGGAPKWLDLQLVNEAAMAEQNIPVRMAKNIDAALGLLVLSGEEQLFPIDGQHRVAGIRAAIASKPALSDDTISVLFVGDRGLVMTRRLFSTLNRFAKPINQGERIALDEDDAFAIVTRDLLYSIPIFQDPRVTPPKQASISKRDKTSFSTPVTIYQIAKILTLNPRRKGWSLSSLSNSRRPSQVLIDEVFSISKQFWSSVSSEFPAINKLAEPDFKSVVTENRTEDGGNLLFRPIGQISFARAVRLLTDRDLTVPQAVHALRNTPLSLNSRPWQGLLWNSYKKAIERQGVGVQKLAAELILHYGNQLDMSTEELKKKYSEITGTDGAEI